jgi:predicted DNA-binding transcriptional regulator YafY
MPQKDTLKRLGRVLNLIGRLNSGRIRVIDVAKEFKVSKRAIQRDLAVMQKAGFFTQSAGDGWHEFTPGISVKNRQLSNEQYNALNAVAAFSKNLGSGLSAQFDKLFQHITNYTPFETFIVPVMPRILTDTIPHIKEIEEAIEWGREIEIEYQYDEKSPVKKHHICPLKVLIADGFAYIFSAYKTKPGLFPKYRIDRIKSLKILDECFSEPEGMQDALEKARSIWGAVPDKERTIKVKLKITDWARDYFLRHELVGGQTVKKQKDGSLLFEAKLCQLPELVPHILRWMPNVTVLEPKALKEEVMARVNAFRKNQKN